MNRHSNNFDFLRFLAALFVLITHSFALKGIPDNLDYLGRITNKYYPLSFFGVQFFFLISGYLILKSYLSDSRPVYYLWKRFLRLIPGLLVLLLFVALFLGPSFTTLTLSAYFSEWSTIRNFLMNIFIFKLSGNLPGVFSNLPLPNELVGSLWTLSFEVLCYLGIPILGILGLLKYRSLLLFFYAFLTVLCFFPYLTYQYTLPIVHLKLSNLISFSSFFLGGMLVHLYRDKIKYTPIIFFISFIIIICSFIFNNSWFILFSGHVLVPYILFYIAFLPSSLNKFGKWGDFSYGIYIYGFPIQQTLVHITENSTSVEVLILLSIILTLPFAYLSWKFVEEPALRLKNLT